MNGWCEVGSQRCSRKHCRRSKSFPGAPRFSRQALCAQITRPRNYLVWTECSPELHYHPSYFLHTDTFTHLCHLLAPCFALLLLSFFSLLSTVLSFKVHNGGSRASRRACGQRLKSKEGGIFLRFRCRQLRLCRRAPYEAASYTDGAQLDHELRSLQENGDIRKFAPGMVRSRR